MSAVVPLGTAKPNIKSAIVIKNWKVYKFGGGINVDSYNACSSDESTHSGVNATAGKRVGCSADLKKLTFEVGATHIDKNKVLYVMDKLNGKWYKLLFGNKYSNAKYKVQTEDEIQSLLQRLPSL